MKKFLAVFDCYKISESTLEYAIRLAKSANAHLVGLFPGDSYYHSFNIYDVIAAHKDYEKVIDQLTRNDTEIKETAINKFQGSCKKAGIPFSIRRDERIDIQELKSQSMFSDLVIINERETFTAVKEKLPTRFIKELLAGVQCPVLVVPSVFEPIDKIILLYDGGPASVYAIKMFSYILGNSQNLPVKVFTVKEKKKSGFYMPDTKLMREFIKRHFPKATFDKATGNAELEICDYLRHLPKNQLVVMGAYQRSEISRLFKISMADTLMKELEIPLFIAHNK